MANIDLVVCGVGAGATYVYDGEYSSTFLLRVNGRPLLLLDCGAGAVRSVYAHVGSLPDHVYVSHNHTDHAGDLPVMLAVEAQKGHRMTVHAERQVLSTLVTHRLHELQSTGRQLSDFAELQGCQAGQLHHLPEQLALLPMKSRHAERCYGLLIYHQGQPVVGWSADSGYDAALYSALSAAPVLLLDGRARGTSEHAGFSQLVAAATSGLFRGSKVFVYGYGRLEEAPKSADYQCLHAVTPGYTLQLSGQTETDSPHLSSREPAVPAISETTAHMAAAAAAAAAAEATAAAAAATAAALACGVGGTELTDVVMQDVALLPAAAAAPVLNSGPNLVNLVQSPQPAPLMRHSCQPERHAATSCEARGAEQALQAAVAGATVPSCVDQLEDHQLLVATQPGAVGCMVGCSGAQSQQQVHTQHQQTPWLQQQQQQQHRGQARQILQHEPRIGLNRCAHHAALATVDRQRESTATSTSSSTVACQQ